MNGGERGLHSKDLNIGDEVVYGVKSALQSWFWSQKVCVWGGGGGEGEGGGGKQMV